MGLTAGPVEVRVQRWPRGLLRYRVGHQDLLEAADATRCHLPRLRLPGAADRRMAVASSVADAERSVHDLTRGLADLRHATNVTS